MRFSNKVAYVTGATSGIGRACVVRYLQEGAKVFAVGRREDRLKELGCAYQVADVRDHEAIENSVESCISQFGKIDILINSAGVIGTGGLLDTSREEWGRLFDINVDGLYNVTRAVAPRLIESRGAIINVSSVCSLRPYPNVTAYCMTKSATDMFTQCLALEMAPMGVRVNAINPGVVVSELHTVSEAVPDYDAFLERSKTTHPLGRVGQPKEIAALCAFLTSDEAGWITGGLHSIDGGRALMSAR